MTTYAQRLTLYCTPALSADCQRAPIPVSGEMQPPSGYSFVCPHCGSLWASCRVDGQKYIPLSRMCPKHTTLYPTDVAGSVWQSWDKAFNESLSMPFLIREINLLLSFYKEKLL